MMKKINSIGYGGKILGAAAVFGLLIPGMIKLVMLGYRNDLLDVCAKVSMGMGIAIAFFLFVLLAIEFHQDKKQDAYFKAQKNSKLELGKDIYECQSCGNRTVKAEDKKCSICGILFK